MLCSYNEMGYVSAIYYISIVICRSWEKSHRNNDGQNVDLTRTGTYSFVLLEVRIAVTSRHRQGLRKGNFVKYRIYFFS